MMLRKLMLMSAFFASLMRLFGGEEKSSFESAPIYRDMRNLALEVNDTKFPALKGKRVFAVLMETAFSEGAYTLVVIGDGAASLYFSSGGGLIGAGEHDNVRSEALKLVGMAGEILGHLRRADQVPTSKPGETTFSIVTKEGVFTYAAKEGDLGEQRDKIFSEIFNQAHVLIYEIRTVEGTRGG